MTNQEIQQSVEKFRALRAELENELERVKKAINPFGPDFSPDLNMKFGNEFYLDMYNSIAQIEDFLIDSKK
jgi:hypothetical protein